VEFDAADSRVGEDLVPDLPGAASRIVRAEGPLGTHGVELSKNQIAKR
jgi:hypothetical protein